MKIAILTSGGDSAGMNAVVRAIVKAGILKYVCYVLSWPKPLMTSSAEVVRHG